MDEVKNYPPYLDYPKPYKAEISTDCINRWVRKAYTGTIHKKRIWRRAIWQN